MKDYKNVKPLQISVKCTDHLKMSSNDKVNLISNSTTQFDISIAISNFLSGKNVEYALNFIQNETNSKDFQVTELFMNSNIITTIIRYLKNNQFVPQLIQIIGNIWYSMSYPIPLYQDEELLEIISSFLDLSDFSLFILTLHAITNLIFINSDYIPMIFPGRLNPSIINCLSSDEYNLQIKFEVIRFSFAICQHPNFLTELIPFTALFLNGLQTKIPSLFSMSATILSILTDNDLALSNFESAGGISILIDKIPMCSSEISLSFAHIFSNHIRVYGIEESSFINDTFIHWIIITLNQHMKTNAFDIYILLDYIASNSPQILFEKQIFQWIVESFDEVSYSNKQNIISLISTIVINSSKEIMNLIPLDNLLRILMQVIPERGVETKTKHALTLSILSENFPLQFMEAVESTCFYDVLMDSFSVCPDNTDFYEPIFKKICKHHS